MTAAQQAALQHQRGIRLASHAQITEIAATLNLAPEDFELRCVLVHEERA